MNRGRWSLVSKYEIRDPHQMCAVGRRTSGSSRLRGLKQTKSDPAQDCQVDSWHSHRFRNGGRITCLLRSKEPLAYYAMPGPFTGLAALGALSRHSGVRV